ncbi:MAG: hypothetical protein EOP24_15430 [Hyphomicrobiales bacterium]|nr:MAG: hypothetical protein EOP24_15430 [Hyphomicrobiales bacterium]
MQLTFGPFVLDEEARALMLRGQARHVQPRVFDLLAYLVRNAGRVVPKDELLDALWPNVTVTESSLQRAASLARRVLAEGGVGEALRNFARHGYRFALDAQGFGGPASIPPVAEGAGLAAARAAMSKYDWDAATGLFAEASAAGPLDAEDFELWALADECRGHPVAALPALHRAIEAHLAAGRNDKAARTATTVARVELERGSSAAAQGWLERAGTILADADNAGVRAHLLWMRSRLAASSGRPEDALRLASSAAELGASAGDPGLEALTLVYKGFFQMSLGQIEEGSRLQNHAAAIALSSHVDPITGSLVYCNILWTCRTFADWERALQWSDGFDSWCDASFAERPGSCNLHRAEILGARGTLIEAFDAISRALPKLIEEESWSLGDGYRVRGDVAAMLGDFVTADADYAMAYALGWDAEPGHAVRLFEQGDAEAALTALDRTMQGRGWFHLQRHGVLLVNAARIAAKSGDAARAEGYLAELTGSEERWPQPAIRAMIAETRAALLPVGDLQATQLRILARQLWTSAKVDYHATRVRLELAEGYIAAGDKPGAEAELGAAEMTARRIGSPRLIEAAAALRHEASIGKMISI